MRTPQSASQASVMSLPSPQHISGLVQYFATLPPISLLCWNSPKTHWNQPVNSLNHPPRFSSLKKKKSKYSNLKTQAPF